MLPLLLLMHDDNVGDSGVYDDDYDDNNDDDDHDDIGDDNDYGDAEQQILKKSINI